MPSVGIRIVYQGNNSSVGHMYTVFKRDDGTSVAFGRYLGGVNNTDGEREKPGAIDAPDVSRDFPVSQSAFDRALAAAQQAQAQGAASAISGFYDPFTNSCVDFAWSMMKEAGLTNSLSQFEGYFWPKDNTGALNDSYYDYFRRPEFNKEGRSVDTQTNTQYTAAKNWQPPRDPLVLDLDGDGIETVGIFGAAGAGASSSPILFDHDADSIRTGTGWIKADDALLVRDINGNGTIDSGRELFGDNTLLPNNTRASNGFTALAQHDTNADGQINSQDAIYSQLKIWRDLNQDGTSQAGELQTLAQAGIASIGVQGAFATTDLGQGNSQIAIKICCACNDSQSKLAA
jgi:hypothetical protein